VRLRALFVAVGVLYAVAASIGKPALVRSKNNFDKGHVADAFIDALASQAVYPFEHFTREMASTMMVVANGLPPEVALDVINRGLASDPWSPHLLWLKCLQELRRGNLDVGRHTLEKMERIAYGWAQTKNAREIYEALIARGDTVQEFKDQ
tara:strand:+ start:135 stop:587 length:453 start_codon:yes stop_codon:yes gene_type:complete